MLLKVCGMRDSKNLEDLVEVHPDFIGFIFFEKSKRHVTDFPNVAIPDTLKKVGVFVNEAIAKVIEKIKVHELDAVQLHGEESALYCKSLKEQVTGIEILKAFSVDAQFDFELTTPFEEVCDLFIFDTKGKERGGNGVKFDWQLLAKYKGELPYLLSGGINLNDVPALKEFMLTETTHKCIGVDVNSGFEIAPGLKNIEEIKQFKELLP